MTTPTAAQVWRDYEISAVPGSGPNKPDKREIRAWGAFWESLLSGSAAGLAYSSLGAINADLLHAAHALAIVYGDATSANNGMYVKNGASGAGSWTRIGDLPNGIVRLTVTGGTANAIVATATETPTVPGNKLYLMTPALQNTAATTINGTPLKNAFGSDLASGSLLADSQVLMAWAVDHYQLLISANVDASAILAAAQAAAVASAGSAATAAATAATVASTVGGVIAPSRAAAILATIPAAVTGLTLMGYYAEGDSAPITYKKVGSMPSVFGKFQSADGAWWQIVNGPHINVQHYGAKPSSSDADKTINKNAFAHAQSDLPTNGSAVLIPPGRYHTEGPLADLLNKKGIEFIGCGSGNGQTGTAGSSEIVYTEDTGPLIRLNGTQAISFRRLTLGYNSASYTLKNIFIDLHTDAGAGATSVTDKTLFEECDIAGWNTSAKNAILMNISKTLLTTIRGGYWQNAYYGLVGAVQADRSDYANGVVVDDVEFDATFTNAAIVIGGINWKLSNLTLEPPNGTAGAAPLNAIQMSPWGAQSLSIDNGSFEDANDNSGAWINFNATTDYGTPGKVEGLSVTASLFQCGSRTDSGLAMDLGSVAGVSGGLISANYFNKVAAPIGFIGISATVSNIICAGNSVGTASGVGVGLIFPGGLPTGASIVDNNDGNGIHIGNGQVMMTQLPTADPHVVGRLWRNSGVVTVSAG